MQNTLFEDVCANRHKNNPASVDANKSADKVKALWYARIRKYGQSFKNFTSKEIGRYYKTPINIFSGRISELKTLGEIEETSERREGCIVLTLHTFS